MEIDLRAGAAFTRWQTLRLQRKFAGMRDQLISYGPCQYPTLGFVVERFLEVEGFVPENFWKIVVRYEGEAPSASGAQQKLTCEFLWSRNRLFDQYVCGLLYQLCLDKPQATVTLVLKKPAVKYKPKPLTTIELQKLVSRRFRISATDTLNAAERLYQKGFISYPRTETNRFSDQMEFSPFIRAQTADPEWGAYANGLLQNPNKFQVPRKGDKDDQSHPPIHPLKGKGGEASIQDHKEKIVYEVVVRHFLACCSQDANGEQTTVNVVINGERFHTSGLVIRERNFLDVYPYVTWNARVIPSFREGQLFTPKSILLQEGHTEPPSLLTEADLITLMDKHGIGTDATIADHITKILERQYVTKQQPGDRFTPTTLGLALWSGYDAMGFQQLTKPQFRAALEHDLKLICTGERTRQVVLQAFVAQYVEVFDQCVAKANLLDEQMRQHFDSIESHFDSRQENFSRCGACKNMMDLRVSDTTHLLYCEVCKRSFVLPSTKKVMSHAHTCPLDDFQVVTLTSRRGNDYQVCPRCNEEPPTLTQQQAGTLLTDIEEVPGSAAGATASDPASSAGVGVGWGRVLHFWCSVFSPLLSSPLLVCSLLVCSHA
jgi:DNA topoisomerase III